MRSERITLGKLYLELRSLEIALKKKGFISDNDVRKEISETALLSEKSLAREWLNPEEDEAWKDL